MRSLSIELDHPSKLVNRLVELLAERDAVELVEHRLVKALDDTVGLRALGLRPRVVDVLDGEIELLFVPLRISAVFDSAIGQHALQLDALLLKEREYAIIQKFR